MCFSLIYDVFHRIIAIFAAEYNLKVRIMGYLKEIQLGSLLATTSEALQRIANSEALARNLRDIFPHPYTLNDARMFIENVRQGNMGYVYGIYHNFEELVGVISMTPGRDVNRYSAEVVYFIGEQYWNKGYATEALKMLPTIAHLNFGFIRLYATVFDFNQPSIRVLGKAGFTKEGILKSSAIKNGKVINEHLFALVLR